MKTKSAYHLPLSSLQWLLTGLFLAAIPLWVPLPAAVLFGFLACMLWRFILERQGLTRPGAVVRWSVGGAGLLMIYSLHDQQLLGLEPGMSLLLLLIALKVLEMRDEREFMLLGFLAFFILLTALFFSQSLLVCAYVAVVFVILLATLVQFTGGAAEGFRPRPLLRYTSILMLQTLPLVVLLFVFLPRRPGGGFLQIKKPNSAQSGMSEQLNPGTFAELAQNEETAFRAQFPDGVVPPVNQLYWRVTVFTECLGLSWRPDRHDWEIARAPVLSGPKIEQVIMMEPQTGGWAYALDRPLQSNSKGVSMRPGNVLKMRSLKAERTTIRVTSQLGNDRSPLTERGEQTLRAYPQNVGDRTQRLVDSWLQKTKDPRELIGLAKTMFRQERFRYTLSPGLYSNRGLDEFLFERKAGFCEHYAAAFATMMRMAGLPARIVAGYQGGERNPFSDYLIVRQADAHAWVEVWIQGEGWVRFDPVEFINPLLVDANTPQASRFPTQATAEEESGSVRQGSGALQRALRSVRLGWDTVNFQWNLHVVSYDHESQRDFFHSLGIHNLFSWRLLLILIGGVLAALAAVYFLVRQKPPPKDWMLLLYRELCEVLARRGIVRLSNEGPQDFARRAAKALPENAPELMKVFELFIASRYGKQSTSAQEIRAHLRNLKRSLRERKAQPASPELRSP